MRVLIVGCGWLGSALAQALVDHGHTAEGVVRSLDSARRLESLGIRAWRWDVTEESPPAGLEPPEAVIYSLSAGSREPGRYRRVYVEGQHRMLDWAASGGTRVYLYTGSTGVFGQSGGVDVDETTPPEPADPPAEALLDAEREVLRAASSGLRAMVVRLSGLYGPGRTHLLERLRAGRIALTPGSDPWMNFCHRDDAVAFVLRALARGRPGAVYHGSDAAPTRRGEVLRTLAALAGLAPPPASAETGPSRPRPDRRVLSERSRRELGIALRYPTFADGYAALVRERQGAAGG